MKKSELKTAQDNQVIMDYIFSYRLVALQDRDRGHTKAMEKHLADLDSEMLKRGILTQEQIDILNERHK